MEHRRGNRLESAMRLIISNADGESFACSVKNVSASGLFMQCERPVLHLNEILSVTIGEFGKPQWCTRAMVIRASIAGTALLLENDLPYELLPAFVSDLQLAV